MKESPSSFIMRLTLTHLCVQARLSADADCRRLPCEDVPHVTDELATALPGVRIRILSLRARLHPS